MNTYSKYCPNVFLAQCTEKHEKGDVIIVETKYGKENECIVHNLIYEKGGTIFIQLPVQMVLIPRSGQKTGLKSITMQVSMPKTKVTSILRHRMRAETF